MSLIFGLYMTIYISITWNYEYELYFSYYYYDENSRGMKATFIFNKLFQILIQWSQSGVLLLYFKKVKSSFTQSDLSQDFVSDSLN